MLAPGTTTYYHFWLCNELWTTLHLEHYGVALAGEAHESEMFLLSPIHPGSSSGTGNAADSPCAAGDGMSPRLAK